MKSNGTTRRSRPQQPVGIPADGRKRVVIESVHPQIEGGRYPAKRVEGENVVVTADIFADGHDNLRAMLLFRPDDTDEWYETPMRQMGNDVWQGKFSIERVCGHAYTIEAWVDIFATWLAKLRKKRTAGQGTSVDLREGALIVKAAASIAKNSDAQELTSLASILEERDDDGAFDTAAGARLTELMQCYPDRRMATRYEKNLTVAVERRRALFSAWYELFPRSCDAGGHGTFKDCMRRIPAIASMGFDILYLPPVHPIGVTNRKGRDNTTHATKGDPGSPWAIGSAEGGHSAVNPLLGTMKDFEDLVEKARSHGMEIALDIAFQCSPDHPYITQHPEWFRMRPDGSIQYAENPPKKYEDIVPFDFECNDWQGLWNELAGVLLFWAKKGVRVFRIDNPHTKPFPFWEFCIATVKAQYPDTLFLAEAFTRPKVMQRLAKLGFSQSYTYFTWRNTKQELTVYLTELTRGDWREYFRPNFWPNTPDILPEFLQYGGRSAFIIRFILAATLSSNYGIYGPAYELCVADALPDREEYKASEKFEIKGWQVGRSDSINDLIALVNTIRRENPSLQTSWNVEFFDVDNDNLLFYIKTTPDLSNIIMVIVNLDPFRVQSGWVRLPVDRLGIEPAQTYLVHDLISQNKYVWHGGRNYVELNPSVMPAHIFRVHRRLRRETDFDYYT
jgi:starch synthase (maltosyl-transferring)